MSQPYDDGASIHRCQCDNPTTSVHVSNDAVYCQYCEGVISHVDDYASVHDEAAAVEQAWREVELAKYTTGELVSELRTRGMTIDTSEFKKRHTDAFNEAEGL